MKPRIAVIGKGKVGGALGRGIERAGYPLRLVGNEPPRGRETAVWGEVIVLAVPYRAVEQTLSEMGDAVNGKTLVDGVERADRRLPARGRVHDQPCRGATAKAQVLSLGQDLGFDPVDAGPLTNARSLEALERSRQRFRP